MLESIRCLLRLCLRVSGHNHLSIDDGVDAHQRVLLIGAITLAAVLSRGRAIEPRVAACWWTIYKKKGISDLNGFKSRPDVAPFVLPTFEDVLPEVKHALLDRVSLLRNLHVFINLTEEKRSLDRSTGFKACGKGRKCPTSCLEFILKDYERMELRGRVYL